MATDSTRFSVTMSISLKELMLDTKGHRTLNQAITEACISYVEGEREVRVRRMKTELKVLINELNGPSSWMVPQLYNELEEIALLL